MLEIILIVLISKKIAAQLRAKGRSPGGYVAIFVVLWIGCEILGAVVGIVITMAQNPPGLQDDFNLIVYFFGLAGAAIGGTIGYLIASSVPPIEEPSWEDYDDDDDEERYRERRRRHRPPDDGSFEEHKG